MNKNLTEAQRNQILANTIRSLDLKEQEMRVKMMFKEIILPTYDSKFIKKNPNYYFNIITKQFKPCPIFFESPPFRYKFEKAFSDAIYECFYKIIPKNLVIKMHLDYESLHQPNTLFFLFGLTSYLIDDEKFHQKMDVPYKPVTRSATPIHSDTEMTQVEREIHELNQFIAPDFDLNFFNKLKDYKLAFIQMCKNIVDSKKNLANVVEKMKEKNMDFTYQSRVSQDIEMATPKNMIEFISFVNELHDLEKKSRELKKMIYDKCQIMVKNISNCPAFKDFLFCYTDNYDFMNLMIAMSKSLKEKKDESILENLSK